MTLSRMSDMTVIAWPDRRPAVARMISCARLVLTLKLEAPAKAFGPCARRQTHRLPRFLVWYRPRCSCCRTSPPIKPDLAVFAITGQSCLLPGQKAQLDGHDVVTEVSGSTVQLQGSALPVAGTLAQSYTACTAAELHAAFEGFWGPLWQREMRARPSLSGRNYRRCSRRPVFACLRFRFVAPQINGVLQFVACPRARPLASAVGPLRTSSSSQMQLWKC